jgi:hypothetical protein
MDGEIPCQFSSAASLTHRDERGATFEIVFIEGGPEMHWNYFDSILANRRSDTAK